MWHVVLETKTALIDWAPVNNSINRGELEERIDSVKTIIFLSFRCCWSCVLCPEILHLAAHPESRSQRINSSQLFNKNVS